MNAFVFTIALAFVLASASATPSKRQKRQFFEEQSFVQEPLGLSSGALDLLGNVQSSFSCEGQIYGFYADVGTDCRVFHVCLPLEDAEGNLETLQWSFFCGNQTVFDQSVLTCVHLQDSIPCGDSANYYFRNEEFGIIPPPRNNRF